MSLAVCLLAYSSAVAVIAPDELLRATRSGAGPRMGIAAWAVAIGTVPAAWLGAVGLIGSELVLAGGDIEKVLAGCVAALRAAATGAYGSPVQLGLLALTVLVAIGLAVLSTRLPLGQSAQRSAQVADAAVVEAARVLLARMGVTVDDLQNAAPARPPRPTFNEYVPCVAASRSSATQRTYAA